MRICLLLRWRLALAMTHQWSRFEDPALKIYGEDDIGNFTITSTEFGDSAVIYPVMTEFRKPAEIERLPILLSKSWASWTQEHPEYRIRSTLGILEAGYTVAIHVWFDRLR